MRRSTGSAKCLLRVRARRGLNERRRRLDALGTRYSLPADLRVEAADANGVAAEWTTTPEAEPSRAVLFLHGGGYVSGSLDSHRHMIGQAGREAQTRSRSISSPRIPCPSRS